MNDFEKFKELSNKKKFYSSLLVKKLVIRSMSMLFKFGIDLKWKQ